MYRSRLGNDLSNITLDYVSSIDDDTAIILFDILGSQAHVLMLQENKIITKNDAKKILISLESYIRSLGSGLTNLICSTFLLELVVVRIL